MGKSQRPRQGRGQHRALVIRRDHSRERGRGSDRAGGALGIGEIERQVPRGVEPRQGLRALRADHDLESQPARGLQKGRGLVSGGCHENQQALHKLAENAPIPPVTQAPQANSETVGCQMA